MEDSLAKELLTLAFQRAEAWHSLWNLYYTVAAATLAIVLSGKLPGDSKRVRVVLIVLFLVFAGGNYGALHDTREQRHALTAAVHAGARVEAYRMVAKAAEPPKWWMVILFHIALDLSVVALIWVAPSKKLRDGSEAS